MRELLTASYLTTRLYRDLPIPSPLARSLKCAYWCVFMRLAVSVCLRVGRGRGRMHFESASAGWWACGALGIPIACLAVNFLAAEGLRGIVRAFFGICKVGAGLEWLFGLISQWGFTGESLGSGFSALAFEMFVWLVYCSLKLMIVFVK